MLIVKNVESGSVGEELGIQKGDRLLSFDGYKVVDILDYLYYNEQEDFTLEVEKPDGETEEIEIEKYEDETLGLEFEDDGLGIKTCRNDCIFCFVAQMPAGMRPSLYVKDDDYRQSFLCGNYVTLTNVSDDDIERIVRLNLSPLYVSVHVTDAEARKNLLRNRFAGKILDQLKRLSDGGITVHTQVVLVKGHNDGALLEKTLTDLSEIEGVKSCAVVPCGMTKFRDGLTEIEDFGKDDSLEVIKSVKAFNEKTGRNFALVADDFYLKADVPCEPYEFYGEFDQLENGIGMNALFDHEFNKTIEKRTYRRTFLVVTGKASEKFIKKYAAICEEYCEGLKIYVEGVENRFFGGKVTCTGLLVGRDIRDFVLGFDKDFDELAISSAMINSELNAFLDDMTVEELSRSIGKKIRVTHCDGASFFRSFTEDM